MLLGDTVYLERTTPMKKILLPLLAVFFLALPLRAQAPAADTFPIAVHVARSEVIFVSEVPCEKIEASIDGRHYTLIGTSIANTKFSFGIKPTPMKTGDYKARLVQEKAVNAALYFRQYEFLFADGAKMKFDVIGESEN
jgi:hypothetical protein